MKQYNRIKAKYPDAILLFRVGDFYETFSSDAITTANILGIVLTKRNNGAAGKTELAGFPHHALDTYLPKLVKAGFRVAICDQLEDPKKTKKLVKRGVTELITPGVALNDKILDHKKNNFLCAIYFEGKNAGVSFLDISTGEFYLAEGNLVYINKLISAFNPAEIIYGRNQKSNLNALLKHSYYTYAIDDWITTYNYAFDKLTQHFSTTTLKGFGVEKFNLGLIAAGTALHYMADTEHPNLKHVNKISRIDRENHMWIDRFSIRNLELLQSIIPGGISLIDILDKTVTAMGSRMIKKWLVMPLTDQSSINNRLDSVGFFIDNEATTQELGSLLKQIGDLERITSKIAALKATPRDVVQLKFALSAIKKVKKLTTGSQVKSVKKMGDALDICNTCFALIDTQLLDDAPPSVNKGNIFKQGFHKPLDELREISQSGKRYLLKIQQEEQRRTGIHSLKIGFNNVFGYYLEVTNKYKDIVPKEWIRKQTLTNSERYITEELKELEHKILSADTQMLELEVGLFAKLLEDVQPFIQTLQQNAYTVACLDVLSTFATISLANNYTKPIINNSLTLSIKDGRHPVIEEQLPLGDTYVPNDVLLDNEKQQIIIVTGPNMSGKSALLRQTALIVIMAQMGCFVPAQKAQIGLIDKVFTRVGASDNLSLGESTFMVEMLETASIINNISQRSLILLDEIGRGTSTYDGISIAWSIAEYLHENKQAKPKTLFATHYHELNELTNHFERIKNYHVSTKEVGNEVIFLRKLEAGGSHHSFGIHVAKMAGMPKWIVERARQILPELEEKHIGGNDMTKPPKINPTTQYQLSIFDLSDPKAKEILDELETIDLNTLTPIEAMMKLNELKKKRLE